MGFQDKDLDSLTYLEEQLEPERVVIISCEGRNTEPEYFKALVDELSEHISELVEVKVIPKNDNASEPKDVVRNLDVFLKDNFDFKTGYDEMWVVVDREKVEQRKMGILDVIPQCKKKNYKIILTNPLFEFWLLLHIADISNYAFSDLYENKKVNTKRRFIDKELSNLLKTRGGYNKKKGKFNKIIISEENVRRALKQEQEFENDIVKIIDHLGSNVGTLVKRILNF
ncbi:MAG: RloB family protein [Mariprofundaceae bacterium]|nr:RloB family protein [Mariprofundaceae bacterium]